MIPYNIMIPYNTVIPYISDRLSPLAFGSPDILSL